MSTTPKHQIGGDAFLWQPLDETLQCPSGGGGMPFLATICDNAAGPDTSNHRYSPAFAGNRGVQIVYQFCRECWVIAGYQICD